MANSQVESALRASSENASCSPSSASLISLINTSVRSSALGLLLVSSSVPSTSPMRVSPLLRMLMLSVFPFLRFYARNSPKLKKNMNTNIQNLKQTKQLTKTKTKDEWLDWYVLNGGQSDLQLHDDETVLFHHEHGFVAFFFHDDILEIHHLAGDGKYWQNILRQIMKLHDLHTVRWFTKRNPLAWIRKYGGHIRGYYMEANLNDIKE